MHSRKNILLCPLDWGLGHAARLVPVIKKLLERNVHVFIAADHRPLAFLKKEFPECTFIPFPGTGITYPKNKNMVLKMFFSIPKILTGICREHRKLKKLIREHHIELVISDNRFGLWNKKITSVYITHQLYIQCPAGLKIFEPLLQRLHRYFMLKFDECWIPDFADEPNLSGALSHGNKNPRNAFFIGALSRFDSDEKNKFESPLTEYDVLIMLSGPEPQRTILEEKLTAQLLTTSLSTVILQGKTEEATSSQVTEKIKIISHASSQEMKDYIQKATWVICRPGYTSIMELAALNKKAIFIPTPGQTEQEYLAGLYLEKGQCFAMDQEAFDINTAIEKSKSFTGLSLTQATDLLEMRLEKLLIQ